MNETIQRIATMRPAVPDLIAGIAHEGHVTHLTILDEKMRSPKHCGWMSTTD